MRGRVGDQSDTRPYKDNLKSLNYTINQTDSLKLKYNVLQKRTRDTRQLLST